MLAAIAAPGIAGATQLGSLAQLSTRAVAPNDIVAENARPGAPGWYRPIAPPRAVEGYTAEVSVVPGEALKLHVSTLPKASYRVEVYRLGWYGGDGARLVHCEPSCTGEVSGIVRGMPPRNPETGLIAARWPVSHNIPVGTDWVSGYYMANLVLTSGSHAGSASPVPFIVRSRPERSTRILVQAAVTTWQAYNSWGGAGLYAGTPIATHVSFDRPLIWGPMTTPLTYELQLVRFLERNGHDVSYVTDVDVHREGTQLLDHNLVISNGHDEYWSMAMRDSFEQARDRGVNLAFFSSNTAYWHVRFEDSERTMIGYKERAYVGDDPAPPALQTKRFRHIGKPECELLGVQFTALVRGGERTFLDYEIVADALGDPWFTGTGIRVGDMFRRRVGYEWDAMVPGCDVPTLTVLFRNEETPGDFAHATRTRPRAELSCLPAARWACPSRSTTGGGSAARWNQPTLGSSSSWRTC